LEVSDKEILFYNKRQITDMKGVRMKKRRLAERITALLLTFLLVMGEFAGTGLTVRAADPETSDEEDEGGGEYNPGGKPNVIWVKTAKGDKNLVTEGSVKEGDGELIYNSSSCTLTMKNFNITRCYVKSGTEAYGLYCDGKLNIVVEGDCKVSATAPSDATVIDGIHVDQELSIKSGTTSPLSSLTVFLA
jgi:hypothetical protein